MPVSKSLPCYVLFSQIPEVYTPVLERLLVVQFDSFPQYSEKVQSACCKSVLKVLVAIASKGPVLWGFISSVGMFNINMMCKVGTIDINSWQASPL